ncbi:MAG: acetyl-CoA carboxylase biotin carboxylase subunit, partial [Planctomycetes bacterium]|nr:acetyl-CoA carboxylase biotin carboxylase subunit [Planctomycetota bacterium]
MFSRILVANRGEIALRIIRACRELGIETVAVFSEADRNALYLQFADDRICIGPPEPAESYMNISRIISAAEIADVEAIHPGYGFLSEQSHFAEVCESSKITFIGPTSKAMKVMGDKAEARKLAIANKVPVVPGSEAAIDKNEDAVALAHKLGFPVMIKAVAGGGGRGMRVAHNDISLVNSMIIARREANAAFKDSSLYIEKYIERARHIEVQLVADKYGDFIHLGERDCSLQRRHQKLIEEAPSPVLSSRLRDDICWAAIKLAKAANYSNLGTVEFLVDDKGHYYFIEMNTRLQVEHTVTEMITGVDLVKMQIRLAAGEPLPLRQKKVNLEGAAIECRINAEDPDDNFKPCPGLVKSYYAPGGPGVRVDSHVHTGYKIPPNYDPLIAKLIT